MKTKRFMLFATFLFCSFILFAQINTEKTIQINPYLGLSAPQGDFKNFAESGYVLGISLDKYLSSKFGLGIDLNYQSNGYKNGTDYSIISSPYGVLSNVSGEWSSTNITFGPIYKFGNGKIHAEIYTKAGISMVKSPSEEVTLTGGSYPSFTIFKLDEQKVNALGITAGLRLSYPISDNIAVFVNPQYVYSSSEINYLYKDLSNPFFSSPDGADPVFEPGLLDEIPIQEGVVKPSYFNLNAGIKLSFGGKKKEKIKKPSIIKDNPAQEVKENLRITIVSHKKYERIRLYKDKSEKITWKIYGNEKMVHSYKVKVFHSNYLGKYDRNKFVIEEKIVEKKEYNFKPSNKSENNKEYYYFEVIGLDKNQNEITNEDNRPMSVSRNLQCLEIEVDSIQIICKNPAYDQINGKIHYSGKIYIKNSANCGGAPLTAILNGPPTSWFSYNNPGSSIASDFLIGNAYATTSPTSNINNSDWGWSINTTNPNDPNYVPTPINVAPGNQVIIPIDLWFKQVPHRVDFGAFATNATTPATADDGNIKEEIDDCMCDPCENFEEMAVNVNSINLSPINHPSHSILEIDQTINVSGNSINTIKAELVYFEEIIPNDPNVDPQLFEQDITGGFAKKHLCQICNAKIDGLGIFNGNSTINNISASNPTTRTAHWFFNNSLNMSSGQNSKLFIGVPKSNPLECCNSAYKFTIRYTFEDENCKKCELLVDYTYN